MATPKKKSGACISASISAIFWFSCWTCGWKRMDVRYTGPSHEIPMKIIPGHLENVGNPWVKSPSFWIFVTSFYVIKVQLHPRGLHHVAGKWSQKNWRRSKRNMSKLVTPIHQMANTWLVVYLPLWKIWKSVGMIIPNIWKVIKFHGSSHHQPDTKHTLKSLVAGPWVLNFGSSPSLGHGCSFFGTSGQALGCTTLWWTNIAMENGHRNSGFSH